MDKTLWFIGALIVGVLVLCIYAMYQASEDCEERGGEMVGTGEYTTTFIQSGNTMIPMQSEKYACTVAE